MRNTLTTDQELPLQFDNCLVLYPQPFRFRPLKGRPVFLAILKTSLPDSKYVVSKDGLTYCYRTIYLRRDQCFICIATEEDKKLILADASPSIEVKTIPKYLLFKGSSSFRIIADDRKFDLMFHSPQIHYPDRLLLNKRSESQPYFDRAFNQIKGTLYGLICGTIGGRNDSEIELEKGFQELQNVMTATKGKAELSEGFTPDLFIELRAKIKGTRDRFKAANKKEKTSKFDLLDHYLNELVTYTERRSQELARQRTAMIPAVEEDTEYRSPLLSDAMSGKELLERHLSELNADIQRITDELKDLGRSAKYKDRRSLLKEQRSDLNDRGKELKKHISALKSRINSLQYRGLNRTLNGRTNFDGNIEDIYYKMGTLVTEMNFNNKARFLGKKRKDTELDLEPYLFDIKHLTRCYYNDKVETDDQILLAHDQAHFPDSELFRIIIDTLLLNAKGQQDINEGQINSILSDVIRKMNGKNELTDSLKALHQLQDYRATKAFEYVLPDNTPLIRNFIAFLFKPNSMEELQRYLFNKNIEQHHIAYTFWGAFNGFAAMPKTFTDPIFNKGNEKLMDAIDQHLFFHYLAIAQ
ncbi:hypothetical protein [Mucilaginibacter aquatilis]|uniref:Uncharacterized protein n=1 Tax=Mucilaginibacter aquatilis TaxID=1517760 RepID=A0A6I4I8W1_9SPHI|nr:hypothetical protein [Mucilaginibacter aquatilis]MVN91472.1 hypothetical protein [Mucilaginibacter aquatilis]